MKVKLGMRTVKTAIAVGLSVAISYALKLEYPFYAAIACIVVLQIYSKDTVTAGRNRLLGTLAGGLAGSLFAYLPFSKSIISVFGILVLFFVLSLLKLNKSMTIGGIVFMRILVDLDYSQETPLLFTYNRLLATFIGVLVAVAVNLLLFPYHRTKDNDKRFIWLKIRLFDGLTNLFLDHDQMDLPTLQKDCNTLQEHLEKNSAEYKLFARKGDQVLEMRKAVNLYQDILRHVVMVQELPETCWCLNAQNKAKLSVLTPFTHAENEGEVAQPEQILVYNYHVGHILDCVRQVEIALLQQPRLWSPHKGQPHLLRLNDTCRTTLRS